MLDYLIDFAGFCLSSSFLIVAALGFSKLFGARFRAKCRYFIWCLIILRLCIPIGFGGLPTLFTLNLPTPPTTGLTESSPSLPEPAQNPTDFAATEAPTTEFSPTEPIKPSSPPLPEPSTERDFEHKLVLPSPEIIVFSLILLGAIVGLAIGLIGYLSTRRRYLTSRRLPDERTATLYRRLCDRLELHREPALYISPEVATPLCFGFFRPIILLPEVKLSENSLVGVLAHELIHCKRCDFLIKLACLFARSIHWFNPLVHIAAARCDAEMELSCDELVLSGFDEETRRSYGRVMLELVRSRRFGKSPLTTQFNPRKSAVKERFQNILDTAKKRSGRVISALTLVLCLTLGHLVGCTLDSGKQNSELTDGELVELFRAEFAEAEELYSYFTGYGSPTLSGEILEIYYYGYNRVDDESLSTREKMRTRLLEHFSPELTERLLETLVSHSVPLYAELDGAIWRFDGYAALWDYTVGSETTEISLISRDGDRARFRASRSHDADGKAISAEIFYEVTITDGRLIFDDFELLAERMWKEFSAPEEYTDYEVKLEDGRTTVLRLPEKNAESYSELHLAELDGSGVPNRVVLHRSGRGTGYSVETPYVLDGRTGELIEVESVDSALERLVRVVNHSDAWILTIDGKIHRIEKAQFSDYREDQIHPNPDFSCIRDFRIIDGKLCCRVVPLCAGFLTGYSREELVVIYDFKNGKFEATGVDFIGIAEKNDGLTVTSLERLGALGFGEKDQKIRFIRAFVNGDSGELCELCGVRSGTYDAYKKLKIKDWYAYTAENPIYGNTEIYFGFTLSDVPDELTFPENEELLYVLQEGLNGISLKSVNKPAVRDDAAELLRFISMTQMIEIPSDNKKIGYERFGITCYIVNRFDRVISLAELQDYALTHFGIEGFTPDSHRNGDGYSEVGHGGSSMFADVISRSDKSDGTVELTVQFYADYSESVKSYVYAYTIRYDDGELYILSTRKIADGKYPPCAISM